MPLKFQAVSYVNIRQIVNKKYCLNFNFVVRHILKREPLLLNNLVDFSNE